MSTKSTIKAVTEAVRSTVEQAALAAVERVAAVSPPVVPGAPAPEPPSLEEPTEPQGPLPPKPDQAGPDRRTATGAATDVAAGRRSAQQGAFLTTVAGRAAPRHRPLAQGRTSAARRCCRTTTCARRSPTSTTSASRSGWCTPAAPARTACSSATATRGRVTKAGFLAEGTSRPRSSCASRRCSGSRGSADTVRDTRGFATKFYTDEGTFDLVGNNIPVFFIQDGIKFPDVIHAAKPHPDREIPQAQSAHDTFWDFVSLHTEAQHHTIWNMSDRGIPRSYRTMEGFGVHTFRCVNDGRRDLAGQVPLEAGPRRALPDLGGGAAARRHRPGLPPPRPRRRDRGRRLPAVGARASRSSRTRRRRRSRASTCSTRRSSCPRSSRRSRPIGLLTLTAQPDELLRRDRAGRLPPRQPGARHRRHQRPAAAGAAVLLRRHPADPARRTELRARSRSTGRTRRSTTCCATASTSTRSTAAWRRTSRTRSTAGCPFHAGGAKDGAFVEVPAARRRGGQDRATAPASFDDHFSQARQFWLSMTPAEKEHIVAAYTFELAQVLRAGDQGAPAAGAGEHRPGPVRRGGGRPGPPRAGPDRAARSTSTRARRCRSSAAPGRPTAG